ncbi:hypothetical protein CVT25_000170 [Psilocybe cyanescens]|uniref:gluconokinase n=1 Tax=Psilocybe cyanescens TaxID=93625 RepID=A0A409XQF8_PSICY|nr:hypothetical protein CVT25_000170 [Psilocybe cyanescens]
MFSFSFSKPPLTSLTTPACLQGVSGTGKSTLGSALAQALRMPYVEGDDLHPRANVAKMAAGIPLDDADREPWLELVRATAEGKVVELQAEVEGKEGEGEGKARRKCYGVVISCSALKAYYRDILRGKLKPASSTAPLPLPHPAAGPAASAGAGSRESTEAQAPHPNTIPAHLAPAHPAHLPTYFVFISGARAVLLDRMEKRPGHFMKATMLDSQLRTLEDPTGEEGVVVVSLDVSTEEQVRCALEGLGQVAGEGFREHVRELDALN